MVEVFGDTSRRHLGRDFRRRGAGGAGAGGAFGGDAEPVAFASGQAVEGGAAFAGIGGEAPAGLAGGVFGQFDEEILQAAADGIPREIDAALGIARGGGEALHFGHGADGGAGVAGHG